jgi:predicted enzyme related to lactoylglutathione lyase
LHQRHLLIEMLAELAVALLFLLNTALLFLRRHSIVPVVLVLVVLMVFLVLASSPALRLNGGSPAECKEDQCYAQSSSVCHSLQARPCGCREGDGPSPSGIFGLHHTPSGARPMPPTLANGKICYLELPATDVARSSEFYETIFHWKMRTRGNGHIAFDDTVGQVSGSFVTNRSPWSGTPGLLVYVMVDSVAATLDAIVAHGGTIVQPIGGDAPEITARFSDPAGNVLGLYQEPA